MRIVVGLGVAATLAACDAASSAPPPPRVDLLAATGVAYLQPAGVAVDGDGDRFFLDQRYGLFRVDGADATMIMTLDELPTPEVPVQWPVTDLVALGDHRFALTAIGDGFLLDLGTRTLRSYFCYVPDGLPVGETQRTDAVAYDAQGQRLYAQPRTFNDGVLVRSEIAEYESSTGIDFGWYPVAATVEAGGMVFVPGRGLLVGDGSQLYRFDDGALVLERDLAADGVTRIEGLALEGDHLLVLDGDRGAGAAALVTVEL